jgi:hypothetical protein
MVMPFSTDSVFLLVDFELSDGFAGLRIIHRGDSEAAWEKLTFQINH